MATKNPERRATIINVRVTPSELLRIKWVAGMRGVDVSTLAREMFIDPVLAEHKVLADALKERAGAA